MEGQQRRGAAAWWLLVAVCLAAPWVTRAILLVEKRHGVHFVDLRGFLSDGSVALLAIGLIGLCLATRRAWGRVLAWIVATGFILSTFAIYEVVAAFDSLHGLAYARLLADPIFVGGSVRHLAHPVLLATMLGLVTLGTAFGEAPRKAWWGRWALASVLVVLRAGGAADVTCLGRVASAACGSRSRLLVASSLRTWRGDRERGGAPGLFG